MNEPLREAIEDILDHYETDLMIAMGIGEVEMTAEQHDNTLEIAQQAIMQLFRTTITDLQSEMPTKETIDTIHKYDVNTFNKGINQAVQQQQAAFKKVLEEMK